MVIDSGNNIYISGQSDVLFKIASDGTLVWQRILQQSGSGYRALQISSIQVLSSSLISVAGQTSNGAAYFLPAFSLVNVNGTVSSSRYFSSAAFDNIDSQAISSAGSIYLCYRSSSNYNLVRVFNGVGVAKKKYTNASYGIKIIGNGAGDTAYLGATSSSIPCITKVDSNLSVLWKLNGNFVFTKALELNGFVYVTGYDASSFDGVILKIDASTAVLVWAKKYLFGSFSSVAADSSGNIYVAGNTSFDKKGIILKLDSSGNLIWSKSILISGLVSNQYTYISSIVVNNTNNTFCVQFAVSTSSTSCFMLSVPTDGTLTGAYTVGGTTFDYSDNFANYSSISPTFSSLSISLAANSGNEFSFTLSPSVGSLTYSKISIP